MKLIPDSLFKILPPRGLLRWRDLSLVTALIRDHGIIAANGQSQEIPDGLRIDLSAPATTSETMVAPLQPYAADPYFSTYSVKPGLVMGGTGWLEPILLRHSIFAFVPPVAPTAAEIFLKVKARPILKSDDYAGSSVWRGPLGTVLLSATIESWNEQNDPFVDVTAMATVTSSGSGYSAFVSRDAVKYIRLGTRNATGDFEPDQVGQRVFSFSSTVSGSTSFPEFTLLSTVLPWLPG